MELVDAYRILEVAPGSSKDVTREARNVLAKVWHPDRHATDPKLHDRAAEKLRQINEAYAAIEGADFPPLRAVFTPQGPAQREAPPA
ncbi:MAG: DnaJ domain-containing protein, partial [Kofleriaceae bacterium]